MPTPSSRPGTATASPSWCSTGGSTATSPSTSSGCGGTWTCNRTPSSPPLAGSRRCPGQGLMNIGRVGRWGVVHHSATRSGRSASCGAISDFVPAFTSGYRGRRGPRRVPASPVPRPDRTGATAVESPVIQPRPRTIPEATVARLAVYLRVLSALVDGGRSTVSSGELAAAAGVNPAGLRKDLSHLGPCGVRGVGYEVATLRDRISGVLGVERARACVLVGIGNLGSALADYAGFGSRGFEFVGLFDASPARIGQRIGGLTVRPPDGPG